MFLTITLTSSRCCKIHVDHGTDGKKRSEFWNQENTAMFIWSGCLLYVKAGSCCHYIMHLSEQLHVSNNNVDKFEVFQNS